MQFQFLGQAAPVQLEQDGDHYRIHIGVRSYRVRLLAHSATHIQFVITDPAPAQHHEAIITFAKDTCWVGLGGQSAQFTMARKGGRKAGNAATGGLSAAMNGQVISVLVAEGDTVQRGQPLVIMEAMKMEIRLTAPAAGKVERLWCKAGQVVERGTTLVSLVAD
jgi:acetyl/propionyl-CoA carboxylase alpha subunit